MSENTERSHICLQPDLSPPLRTPSPHVAPGGSLEFHKSSGSGPQLLTLLQQPVLPTILTTSRKLWSVGSTFSLLSQPSSICQQILAALSSTGIQHPPLTATPVPLQFKLPSLFRRVLGTRGTTLLNTVSGDLLKPYSRSHVTPLPKTLPRLPI